MTSNQKKVPGKDVQYVFLVTLRDVYPEWRTFDFDMDVMDAHVSDLHVYSYTYFARRSTNNSTFNVQSGAAGIRCHASMMSRRLRYSTHPK